MINKKKVSAIDMLTGILKKKVPVNVDWKGVKASYLKKKYSC